MSPATQQAISVFIVTEVRLYEQGLIRLFNDDPRIKVAGSASDGPPAPATITCGSEPPHVLLLDTSMPGAAGVLDAVAGEPTPVRVIAIAVRNVEHEVVEWAEAGVAAIVGQEDSIDELLATIAAVADGETLCSPRVAATLLRRVATQKRERAPGPAHAALTTREREIVRLIDAGLSNKEIAAVLNISLPTAKNHVHHIIEKLNVTRRAEAAAMLRRERATVGAALD
jgi:DNA-binding NarL/FixJ family response regulator